MMINLEQYHQIGNRLISAARHDDVKAVSEILDSGFDVNYVARSSASYNGPVLFYAIVDGSEKVVAELIKRGTDVNYFNGYYSAPLDTASRAGNANIINLLENAGAKSFNEKSQEEKVKLASSYAVKEFTKAIELGETDNWAMHYTLNRIADEDYAEVSSYVNDCWKDPHSCEVVGAVNDSCEA